MNENNCDCGLWKEQNGTFSLIEPSDCHEVGGHYFTKYDKDGTFLYTNVPWQVGDRGDLSAEEMAGAQ